jgi:heavy metal sensor kinase
VLRGPALSTAVLNRGKSGEIVYESVQTTAGKRLRRIVMPIHEEGEVRYLLQAEASLALKEQTLRDLIVVLVLSSMAMLIVSWFGSDWVARKTVKAIAALSRTAEAVSESSFNDRVNMDVPFDEFQRVGRAFNAMLDRLQKGYEIQRHFVDYAAHEMQTPLTVLQGNLEVALQKKTRTAEEYREVLVSNLKQVERLIRLTKSLLTLARFASDRPPVHLAPVKLEPLLRELVEDLALIAADRNIRLSLDDEAVPVVLGDELRLKELVINLLDNALRYTESGGAVTVRLRALGDVVTVAVQDTGQGIGSEHLPHLFERFYRTNTGRAKNSDGTGLGLPIVKEIAQAHNGMITVESEVDKGSIFTLTLHAMKLLNIGVMKQ